MKIDYYEKFLLLSNKYAEDVGKLSADLENSIPIYKIKAVIYLHEKNKVGDDKLDYADDLVISTLERILNVESDESNTSIS